MENPLSVRANAFAIASIMSDPEAAGLADTAAMLQAYGYCMPGLTGNASSLLPSHHRHQAGLEHGSTTPFQLNNGACRSTASSGADCRFQIDWPLTAATATSSAAGGSSLLLQQQHQQHLHHQGSQLSSNGSSVSSGDVGEYSSGLKGMEGESEVNNQFNNDGTNSVVRHTR